MRFLLKHLSIPSATIVADEFIDNYMAQANGEFVKVYLYIVRHAGKDISITSVADDLCMTERDAQRAIDYWKKLQMIDIADGDAIIDVTDALASNSNLHKDDTKSSDIDIGIPSKDDLMMLDADVINLEDDKQFTMLTSMINEYLKKYKQNELMPNDYYILGNLYSNKKVPVDLILYIIETSFDNGIFNMRYTEKTALSMLSRSIDTVEKAKKEAPIYNKLRTSIMKKMGISGRALNESELKLIDKWKYEYKFSNEIILNACDRNPGSDAKGNFAYVDKILSSWHEKDIKTIDAIKEADKIHNETSARFENFKRQRYRTDKQSGEIDTGAIIYRELMQEYDHIRAKKRDEQTAHIKEVCDKIPKMRELEGATGTLALKRYEEYRNGDKAALDKLKDDISKVAADKRELLIAAGYPIDYMDLHYECPICQDTGYVDGKKCTCFQIKANKMLYADKDTANIDKDTNAG